MAHIILYLTDIPVKKDKLTVYEIIRTSMMQKKRKENEMDMVGWQEQISPSGALPDTLIGHIMDVVASGSTIGFLSIYYVFTATSLFFFILVKPIRRLQQIYHANHKFYGMMQYVPKCYANVSVVSSL